MPQAPGNDRPPAGPARRAVGAVDDGRRSSRRRDELLALAADVFVERGYDGASMREIGDRAGVLSGSLYHHFDTKEQLLFELVRDVYDEVLSKLDEIEALDATSAHKLRLTVETHVRCLINTLPRTRLFLHEFRSLSDEHKAEIVAAEERYVGFLTRIIEHGQREGSIRGGADPRLARMVVFGAANWVYRWYRPDGPSSADEIARGIADILVDGLAGPGPVARAPRRRRSAVATSDVASLRWTWARPAPPTA